MNIVETLVDDAYALGARFRVDGEQVIVEAPSPLPAELMRGLREHKTDLVAFLHGFSESEPWVLREWRRACIPEWRDTLRRSIEQADRNMESYARWMLVEVLLDDG